MNSIPRGFRPTHLSFCPWVYCPSFLELRSHRLLQLPGLPQPLLQLPQPWPQPPPQWKQQALFPDKTFGGAWNPMKWKTSSVSHCSRRGMVEWHRFHCIILHHHLLSLKYELPLAVTLLTPGLSAVHIPHNNLHYLHHSHCLNVIYRFLYTIIIHVLPQPWV